MEFPISANARRGQVSERMSKPSIIALPLAYEKRDLHCKSPIKGLLTLLLLTTVLISPLVLADAGRALKAHERNLVMLKQRVEAIDTELARDRQLHDHESRKLREIEQEISARATALREINGRIETQAQHTRQLNQQQEQARLALARQRELLAAQLSASYQNGRQEKVKLLLNQGDPTQLGRMLGYHDYLARARVAQIEAVTQQALALKELEAELAVQLSQLQTLGEIQAGQLAQLEAARKERKIRLAKLEAEINESGQVLQRIQSEQSTLQKLVVSIRKRLSDIPAEFRDSRPLGQSEGRLPWPVQGQLLANYGQTKRGTSLQWDGIWIAAKAGTPIRAVAEGRVVYVGWLHRYGLLIIAEHSEGYYSLYGHNQEARVEVGEPIKAGQVIAYAGDSGGHIKTGLYFELRKGKNPVNPMHWLSKK